MPPPKLHICIGLEDPTDGELIRYRLPFPNSSRFVRRSSRCDETSKVTAVSILRPWSLAGGGVESISPSASNRRNSVVSNGNTTLMNALAVSNEKDKKQLLDNIHSCLNAMETTRRAAKHICHLHGNFFTAIIKTQRMRVIIDRTSDGLSRSVASSFQSTFNGFLSESDYTGSDQGRSLCWVAIPMVRCCQYYWSVESSGRSWAVIYQANKTSNARRYDSLDPRLNTIETLFSLNLANQIIQLKQWFLSYLRPSKLLKWPSWRKMGFYRLFSVETAVFWPKMSICPSRMK